MPMFFTPKPRQFHFEPRFYNPEKEKWEQLKKKYETADASNENERTQSSATESDIADADLAYFESKVRALDREKKSKTSNSHGATSSTNERCPHSTTNPDSADPLLKGKVHRLKTLCPTPKQEKTSR